MRRPAPLWGAWREVARRFASTPRTALFSDFDGTLAPLANHPGQARLPAATRATLRRLARLPRVDLSVVSGRSLRDLQQKVGLRGLYYIGSHGMEWTGRDGRRHSRVSRAMQRTLRKVGHELEADLQGLPGLYVERKAVSVAVHYRKASPAVAERARRRAERMANRGRQSLRILHGKKIVELLPPGRIDKGEAVEQMMKRLRPRSPRLVVYLGDDTTDESVFPRLKRRGLGIHVGNRSSRADYRLASPAEVHRFLRRVERLLR